jgi:putative peptidoglycan lipid II flippase
VLVRVLAATFYARHDTATPVRGTLLAVAVNIGMKFAFVWALHLGAVGVALGTSLGSWANVMVLFWLGWRRGLLKVDAHLTRALPAILLAAAATGIAALGAVLLAEQAQLPKEIVLMAAVIAGGAAYGVVTLLFRRTLPLGRLAR